MDKDYLAKRLIYLTGRSDPHRINSVFEKVLHELDNYINENIPYKFLKKDVAIRNWITQSDKETVQLIKLWIEYKEESNINIFKNQKEILNFLPNSNRVFWLFECLLKNRIPALKKILKELSAYPELIVILILVYHKDSYQKLRDLIGIITNAISKVPNKGASALKLFLRHSSKGSFSHKEFLSLKPDLACSILHLYSPTNNRYEIEINNPVKLIRKEILGKYESNRKCWSFTPEKRNELVLIEKAAQNFERRKFISTDIKYVLDSNKFSTFKKIYEKLLHDPTQRKKRQEWSNSQIRANQERWFYPIHEPSYTNVKLTIKNTKDHKATDYFIPIICNSADIYRHMNDISWSRSKLILSNIIDLSHANLDPRKHPAGPAPIIPIILSFLGKLSPHHQLLHLYYIKPLIGLVQLLLWPALMLLNIL